jgi:hypothetical protein
VLGGPQRSLLIDGANPYHFRSIQCFGIECSSFSSVIMAVTQTFAVVSATATKASNAIPGVGYGCWKVPKDISSSIVESAIRTGYRHIDCAADYGNEKEVIQQLLIVLCSFV